MNIKKQVLENIKYHFEGELRKINFDIFENKYEIKKLVEKQTLLKRTRAKLDLMYREAFKANKDI